MSTINYKKWFLNDGNNTHAINYPLNENSIVVDLGGYNGVWASQIIEKYNPYVYLLEPVELFYNNLVTKFSHNPKVKIINSGISTVDRTETLFLNGDGTSKFIGQDKQKVVVHLMSVENLLKEINNTVDLVQINIEGEEYDLLEGMLNNNLIEKFLNIQIQFHTFVNDAEKRREDIQQKLSNKFNKLYDYPFIFEGWSIKN